MGVTSKLTTKQQAFVDAYAGNGAEAARLAGFQGTPQALAIHASKLLKLPKVAQALEARRARFEALAAQGVPAEQPKVPKVEPKDAAQGAPNPPKVDPVAQVMMRRIATRVDRQAMWTSVMEDVDADMQDRLRASELLAKSEGDFLTRHEHSGVVVTLENPYAGAGGE